MSDLPHVTDVLRDAGLVDTKWFTQEGRDRGTAVHLATQYLDEGRLDEDSLDPTVRPKVQAYRLFKQQCKPQIIEVELHVRSETFGYCGTLDRYLYMDKEWGILDIKLGGESPWHGVQLAAYKAALDDRLGAKTPDPMSPDRPLSTIRRYSLYLDDTGYKLIPRTNRNDWKVFIAALTIANWRRKWTPSSLTDRTREPSSYSPEV
jgi:hypothetical protein